MNYYERHIGDYLKDTAHLSLLEHGIYGRLLDVYYTKECPILAAQVERLLGVRSDEERSAMRDILNEFFQRDGDVYRHTRCDKEIARYQDKQRKAKASAEQRWAHSERNANALPTHCEGNAPSLQTPDTSLNTKQPTVAPALPGEGRPTLALVDGQPKAYAPPDCPHSAVLALWAEVLPAMPQHLPTQWKGARADHLRARWRETACEKRWTSESEGMAYMRKLFGYVGQSRFLTGRVQSKTDRPPFVVELAWLVNPQNWAKTLEGKFHQDAA